MSYQETIRRLQKFCFESDAAPNPHLLAAAVMRDFAREDRAAGEYDKARYCEEVANYLEQQDQLMPIDAYRGLGFRPGEQLRVMGEMVGTTTPGETFRKLQDIGDRFIAKAQAAVNRAMN